MNACCIALQMLCSLSLTGQRPAVDREGFDPAGWRAGWVRVGVREHAGCCGEAVLTSGAADAGWRVEHDADGAAHKVAHHLGADKGGRAGPGAAQQRHGKSSSG